MELRLVCVRGLAVIAIVSASALAGCGRDYSFRPGFDGGDGGDGGGMPVSDASDARRVDVVMTDVFDAARTDVLDVAATDAVDAIRRDVQDVSDVATGVDVSADVCTGIICNGACVDIATDPQHCGSCSNTCDPVANGSVVCRSGACATTCDPGFHGCSSGTGCFADDDSTACGTSCVECSVPIGGTASCNAGVCDATCSAGSHVCGTGTNVSCQVDVDVQHCGVGAACGPCPAPPTMGTMACTMGGTTCTPSCPQGRYLNGNSCDEPDSCTRGPAIVDVPPGTMVTIDSTFTGAAADNTLTRGNCGVGGTSDGPDRVYQVTMPPGSTLSVTMTAPNHDFYPRLYSTPVCSSNTPFNCSYAPNGVYSVTISGPNPGTNPLMVWIWADSGASGVPANAAFTLTFVSN